jgi:hypothetical protein
MPSKTTPKKTLSKSDFIGAQPATIFPTVGPPSPQRPHVGAARWLEQRSRSVR